MIFIWDINNDYKQSKNNEYTKIAHSAIVSSTTQSKGWKDSMNDPLEFRRYLWWQVLHLWQIDQYNHLNSNINIKFLAASLAIKWLFKDDEDYSVIEDLYNKLNKWKIEKRKDWNKIEEQKINQLITHLIKQIEYNLRIRINTMLENAEDQLQKEDINLNELNTKRLLKMIKTSNKNQEMFKFSDVIKTFLEKSVCYRELVDSLKPIEKKDLGFIDQRYIKDGSWKDKDGKWKDEVFIGTNKNYFSEEYKSLNKIKKFNEEQLEQLVFRKKELKWGLHKEKLEPKLIKSIEIIIDNFSKKNDFDNYENKKKQIIDGWCKLKKDILTLGEDVKNYLKKIHINAKTFKEYNSTKFNNLKINLENIDSLISGISDKKEYQSKKDKFDKWKNAYEKLFEKADGFKKALEKLNKEKEELKQSLEIIKKASSYVVKNHFKDAFSKIGSDIDLIKNEAQYKIQLDKLSELKNNISDYKKLIANKSNLTTSLEKLESKIKNSKIPNAKLRFKQKISKLRTNIDEIDTETKYENQKKELENVKKEFENYKNLYLWKIQLNEILKSHEKKLIDSGIEDALNNFTKENKKFLNIRDNINSIQSKIDYEKQLKKLQDMKSKIDRYISQTSNKVKIKGKTYTVDEYKPISGQEKILGILAAGLLSGSLNDKKNILPGIDSKIFKKFLNKHKDKKEKLINKIKDQIKDKIKTGELGKTLNRLHGKDRIKKIQSLIDLYSKKDGAKEFKDLYDGENLESLLKTKKGKYVKEIKEVLEDMNVDALKNIKQLYKNEKINKETFEKLKKKLEDHKNILKQIWDRTNHSKYKKWFGKVLKEMSDLKALDLKNVKKIPKWLTNGILKGINATTQIQMYVSYGIGAVSASIAILCSFVALNFLKFKKKGLVNIKGKKGLVTTSLVIGIISIIISIGAFLNGGGII